MKKIFILLFITLVSFNFAYELESILGTPTAGLLQRGEAKIETKLYRENGMLIGAKVGLFPRFMFGVNFGGEEVVGNEEPIWHERVEFNAKFRILDEGPQLPAVCVGYDSQGHGSFDKSLERYDIKSKGFYGMASRNFLFAGNLGLHVGINYSMENEDDKDINFFGAIDKQVGDAVILLCEYDTAINDNEDKKAGENMYGTGNGYLNAGVQVRLSDNLSLSVYAYDLLENSERTNGMDRAVKISYTMKF